MKSYKFNKKNLKFVMEMSGIKPEASCMQSKHSTTELYPQSVKYKKFFLSEII